MKNIARLVLAAALAAMASLTSAQTGPTPVDALSAWQADREQMFDAAGIDLATFVWVARPVLLFADSPADPQYQRQFEFLRAGLRELAERDVIVITDTDPAHPSPARAKLHPHGFMLALIDKDGRVVLRKPAPWDIRELTRWIDKSPTREQEVRERRAAGTLVPGVSD
ncbi:DUF4174 domain-containing protein [Limimaricola sp.]|uniref:DUF4174 domain-containing protein n=1 Tax=Limimaricola sp. TaxID=2211665 RepID=UPI0025BF6EE9|nr:DUF4174 domain-containing protein [Limimaricola sp.]